MFGGIWHWGYKNGWSCDKKNLITYQPVFTGITQQSFKNDTLFLNLHLLQKIAITLLELRTFFCSQGC